MQSKIAGPLIFFGVFLTRSETRKKWSGFTWLPSIEIFFFPKYKTAVEVASAPEPAVSGMAISLASFFFVIIS